MVEELRPCPFCGGEAHTRTNTTFDRNYKWTVECDTENCMDYQGCSFYRTEAEAVAAWNTRAERKPTDAVREFAERYEKRIAELEEQIAESAGGTLTAEQVREAWCGNLRRDCLYDPPTPDWQAIADELNARAERTCKPLGTIRYDYEGGYAGFEYETELSCGHKWHDSYGDYPDFCPNCGARVVA